MEYLSYLSFFASILYLYVGIKALKANRKSFLCRLFFFMNLSMAIWAFSSSFLYIAKNEYEYSFWNKAGAFGWCSFEAIVLYFVLIFTENKWIKKWYSSYLVLLPAPVFLFVVLFLFGPNINTNPYIEQIFYISNFLYNFSYLFISILLIFLWGKHTDSKIQKKQSEIIVIFSIIPFILNLLIQIVLPFFGFIRLPNMGQILTLIMLWGVNYAIIQYQFMSISTSTITDQLFQELSELTILTDSRGIVTKVNKKAFTLLQYTEDDMIGKHITDIISDTIFCEAFKQCGGVKEIIEFPEVQIMIKSGTELPFYVSINPIFKNLDLIQGYLIIGEDISVMKLLQDEIINHQLTSEKLKGSERIFRTLIDATPIAILLTSLRNGKILYLNNRTEAMLGDSRSNLMGRSVIDYLGEPLDIAKLKEEVINQKSANSECEVLLKRTNGSTFVALVTMIKLVYDEEEIAFSCIMDMSEQKRSEEMLKLSNENIRKLNDELIEINNMLSNKSVRDGLTNLFNHQYMNEVLEEMLQRTSITKDSFCVMMLDIDKFKKVNDTFGHIIGDRVLMEVADLIQNSTRDVDYIGRYGGEEFIAILPNIDLKEASEVAERIRMEIQNHSFNKEGLKVTISIGVAMYEGEISQALINKADLALYQAKRNGRNRVECAPHNKE